MEIQCHDSHVTLKPVKVLVHDVRWRKEKPVLLALGKQDLPRVLWQLLWSLLDPGHDDVITYLCLEYVGGNMKLE
jgi:hypothetical protein